MRAASCSTRTPCRHSAQMPVSVSDLGVDLLTLSGHKIYGPKGIGALYVRSGVPIEPLLHGGAQERERRAGTENVPGIVGLAAAVRLLLPEREALAARLTRLRDLLIASLHARIPGIALNGHPTERLPNNVNVSFPGGDAEALLLALDMAGISASSGSACTSGSIEPSHVLQAMRLAAWRVEAPSASLWAGTRPQRKLNAAPTFSRECLEPNPLCLWYNKSSHTKRRVFNFGS